METWPSPKRATARSQARKYWSMPVRALRRSHAREHRGVERLDVDAHRVDAQVGDLVDDVEVHRWLELHLDRQARGLPDGMPASGDVASATVDAVGAPGGEGGVHRAVELLGGHRHLGELLRALLDDRAAGVQRDPDATEPALVVVAPVGAGLHHGARERVQVHQADLPVRHTVGGAEVVEAWALLGRRAGEPAGRPRRWHSRRPRPSARTASPAAAALSVGTVIGKPPTQSIPESEGPAPPVRRSSGTSTLSPRACRSTTSDRQRLGCRGRVAAWPGGDPSDAAAEDPRPMFICTLPGYLLHDTIRNL